MIDNWLDALKKDLDDQGLTIAKKEKTMTFTDDDLKRLKDEAEIVDSCQVSNIKALLARLEAAERVVKAHPKLENETISYDDFNSLVAQWRKAAGK